MTIRRQHEEPRSAGAIAVSLALAICGTAAGCASPPVERTPVAIKEAAPGSAVIYFFRPEADQVQVKARPLLMIDNRPVAALEHAAYTTVALEPGTHAASLVAHKPDSQSWNQSVEFKVEGGVTYYVALWHERQPVPTPSDVTAMYGAVGYLLFQYMHRPQGSAAAQFESVDRSVAEFGLAGLRYVNPQDDAMVVR